MGGKETWRESIQGTGKTVRKGPQNMPAHSTNIKEVSLATAERAKRGKQEMKFERERGQNIQGLVWWDTLKASTGVWQNLHLGGEEKQIHFSYKGITPTACRAQIRVRSGKDGSRKTNLEATSEP